MDIIYLLCVLLATFFGFISQQSLKKSNNIKKNKIFFILSAVVLIILMGFREYYIGVDGANYIRNYQIANSMTLKNYYSIYSTEPSFYLLYRFVNIVFDDYQWLFIISATITISFFYRTIYYFMERTSIGIVIFVFSCTMYFYFFGIMRMGISVSIVSYSYTKLLEKDYKRYFLYTFLAFTFHFSAIYSILVLLFNYDNRNDIKYKMSLVLVLYLVPIIFIVIKFGLYPIITIDKYIQYTDRVLSFNLTSFFTLIMIVFFVVFKPRVINNEKHYSFFLYLLTLKFLTELFAPLLGITRMVWYFNISIPFLFSYIIYYYRDKITKVILTISMLIYSLTYSYYAYFGNSERGKTMLPYESIFTRKEDLEL